MRPGFSLAHALRVFLATFLLSLPAVHAYFNILNPTKGAQWVNGEANLISWSKGLLDDIIDFDIELIRLGTDGIVYVAQGIDAHLKSKAINLYLKDVPPGNDYFLIFLNSTHGVTYTTSNRFSILASGTSPSGEQPKPDPAAPSVTISGGPNPTAQFATTFPAASGALKQLVSVTGVYTCAAVAVAMVVGAGSVFL